ncbi:sigma-54-dependent transcriptional regulator [Thalassotalea sediminis]|uniref:sigma-54-dependent transcriptional regulator n=1 Tax=Thalassotalea sediminis TaxID=1759089 RepID=UPI0025733B11|nr:sigma-54 dependent transcriptional regulator [Thalassotalea sediminis]
MKQQANILIVDDDQDILVAGKLLLKRKFSDISICNQPEQLPTKLQQTSFDVILLDMNFGPGESSGEQGLYWLNQILTLSPSTIVIMITAHGSVDIAVEAIKRGATDFIAKPWQNEKVISTVTTALELKRSREETKHLKAANEALKKQNSAHVPMIIGQSSAMTRIFNMIERAAPTDANVLILGENGTGKELVAHEIHRQSKRAEHVFLSIDLGALSETLFESELFGHKKGAFTGAQQDRIGMLKAADGGTLFLDEIGNLPLHLQAKLLTVLEQRKVTPVGSNTAESFDVRIIAATNLDPVQLQDEQSFRQDLLFRLNTVEITLPPLRERGSDILAIAEHYLTLYEKKYQKASLTFDEQAKEAMLKAVWPGNVRALRHAIERAVIMCDTSSITSTNLQLTVEQPLSTNNQVITDTDTDTDIQTLDAIEKQAISKALKRHKYNISHSAKALGLTRAALYRRMEKHGL